MVVLLQQVKGANGFAFNLNDIGFNLHPFVMMKLPLKGIVPAKHRCYIVLFYGDFQSPGKVKVVFLSGPYSEVDTDV